MQEPALNELNEQNQPFVYFGLKAFQGFSIWKDMQINMSAYIFVDIDNGLYLVVSHQVFCFFQ